MRPRGRSCAPCGRICDCEIHHAKNVWAAASRPFPLTLLSCLLLITPRTINQFILLPPPLLLLFFFVFSVLCFSFAIPSPYTAFLFYCCNRTIATSCESTCAQYSLLTHPIFVCAHRSRAYADSNGLSPTSPHDAQMAMGLEPRFSNKTAIDPSESNRA